MTAPQISSSQQAVSSSLLGLPVKPSSDLVAKQQEEELIKLRTVLRDKLSIFGEKLTDMRQRNDWMIDMNNSLQNCLRKDEGWSLSFAFIDFNKECNSFWGNTFS